MNKPLIKKIIALLLLSVWSQFYAQSNLSFEKLTLLDGLSNSTVQNIIQDQFGLLWFATSDGLNKYDGYEFTVYREDPEIPNSLAGNLVVELYEDSQGNLWIGTEKALNLYNRDADNFESFYFDADNNQAFYNGVLSIYEDHSGRLILGKAYHGLTYFDRDEHTFTPMFSDQDSSAVMNFAIFDIMEDSQNRLWFSYGRNFGVADGINRVSEDRSETVDMNDSLKQFTGKDRFSLFFFKDRENRLFLNSYDGVSFMMELGENEFKHYPILDGAEIFRMTEDSNGDLWYVTSNNGLLRYDPVTGETTQYVNNPQEENSISSNFLLSIIIDASGVFWIGSSNSGINKCDPVKEPMTTIKIADKENPSQSQTIACFAKSYTYPGKIWVAAITSVNLYDPKTRQIKPINIPIKLKNGLNIRSITETDDNVLWIGTWGDGLLRYDLIGKKVEQFGNSYKDANFLTSGFIRFILNDENKYLWIATQNGLNQFNVKTNENQRFNSFDTTYTSNVLQRLETIKNSRLFAGILQAGNNQNLTEQFEVNEVSSFLVSTAGEAFLINDQSLWDHGWIENQKGDTVWKTEASNLRHAGGDFKNFMQLSIITLQPGRYKLRYVSDDSHSYDEWNAAIPYDPNMWGIQLYKLSTAEVDYFSENIPKKEFDNSLVGNYIRTVYKDSNGNIWAGSNTEGFSIYHPATARFKQYASNQRSSTVFSNSRVNSVIQKSQDEFYLATFGGLMELNISTGEFRTYTVNNGLPTNYLLSLLKDSKGNIWISSLKGLVKMTRTGEEQVSFINYDMEDGLQGYTYTQGAFLKDENENIYFGGENGFNVFKPGNINTVAPKIVLNRMLISGKVVTPSAPNSPLKKSISVTDSLLLSYNQNDVSFEFTALHYVRPERNQYAYKLVGFDEEWHYDNRRYATYTNLDPGEYTFSIRASNSDGVWSKTPKQLAIVIYPPWWKSIYAYFTYVLVLIVGFISFQKFQKNKILQKERQRQQMQEAELRAVAAEAQARAVQAENDRKTKELEEARNLQLSMLPETIPELPNLDIAVFMSTATEVGGDYYDFHIDLDGTLTVVAGDATGHGLNAGTMVTATKSLFSTHASNPDILYTFSEISRCLRNMRLRLLSMCLMILKFKGNKLTMSAAGMPPALIYRKSQGVVEEVIIKGMPLGAPSTFVYELKETTLEKGDTILLMSDGFPELFNRDNEMYGYERINKLFGQIGTKSSEEIISDLRLTCDNWSNGKEQADDITFVVLQMK